MRKKFAILFFFIAFFLFSLQSVHAFSFAVIGDTQKFKTGKRGKLQSAAKNIKSLGVDFSISLGDICNGPATKCPKKILKWKKITYQLFPKMYAVMGNHDLVDFEFWQSVFNSPLNGPAEFLGTVFSFDFEDSHFIVLNAEKPIQHVISASQLNWLEEDLARNTKSNVFVFFHEPAFPAKHKVGSSLDAYPESRDALWEILDRHGVTAVFSGHEHITARRKIDSNVFSGASNSIYQFIVGNTAAYSHQKPNSDVVEYFTREKSFAVVDVEGNRVTVNIFGINGKMLNSFSFLKSVSAPNSLPEESDNPIETETQNQDTFSWQ
ncbi:MAG: hypothetical protein A3J76_00780 [Candidatus Moranbacteria bacterium RBG_13_45_13]|nr:MAG: hypothetical protein A3J76_00780 [Candidatus Moranbacteria bacterium RBG_13_45_13]